MSFTSVTLTGQVQDVSGNNVAAATVIATLSNEISDGINHVIPSPISCLCDDDGNLSLTVLANDDETTLPTGTYYNFQVKGQGITASFSAIVPSASAPSVDLFSLSQLNTQPTPATTYVESVGGLNGVVGFTSPDSSVTIGTSGNNVTLEAAGVTSVTSVTAANGTITIGGTEDAPTVKVTADTFDTYGAASTAQTNAISFTTSAVGTETFRAEAAEALLVASVTAGNGTITVGGTDTAPTIEVTADTYDAYGAASTAQTAAESFATSAVATETSRAETAEAAAQSNAETFATSAVATETSRAETAEAAAQSNAETFATSAASTAQSNAETFATSAVATETSRAESAEAALVSSVTAGNSTITVGGTATAPTVEVTSGTYDAYGAASTAQTAAESFATSAVATETSRAETAEAAAQSNAETFATSAVATETSRAETAEAAAQSNAETFATSAASTAQSNAETFATSAVGTETSRAEAAEAALVSSVTAGNGTITVGGTATAPTIEVTSGTYDASGAAAAAQSAAETYASSQAGNAQSNAETFATSAVATETSRAETAEALLAAANDVVTSVKGLQGVVGITSPDSSVTIGTSGNNITLEAASKGLGTPATSTTSITDGTDTVVKGTLVSIASSTFGVYPAANSRYRFTVTVTKTAAGSATWSLKVKIGTAGTGSDGAIATWTSGTNTANLDSMLLIIEVVITATGSGTSATAACVAFSTSTDYPVSGLGSIGAFPGSTAGFNSTANNYIHIDINGGTSAVMTAWGMAQQIN